MRMMSNSTAPSEPRPRPRPRLPYYERLCKMYANNNAEINRRVCAAPDLQVVNVNFWTCDDDWRVICHTPQTPHDQFGYPLDHLHFAEHESFPEDRIPAIVPIIAGMYRRKGLPLAWTVGPAETPLLEAALRSLNFAKTDDRVVMFCDLETFRREELTPQYSQALVNQMLVNELCRRIVRVSIWAQVAASRPLETNPRSPAVVRAVAGRMARIRNSDYSVMAQLVVCPMRPSILGEYIIESIDQSSVTDWVRSWTQAADDSLPIVRHWAHVYKSLLARLATTQFRMFAARLRAPDARGRRPIVGTGLVHCYAGVALVQHIGVDADHAGRGLEHKLVHYALRVALHLKYTKAMATVERWARAPFCRVGFRNVGRAKKYVLMPEPLPSPSNTDP
ncbi:hypothetical protein F5X98DRAFT_383730 [Xylaria grammica]|nr:hypothetical protein F5X98DRAFT_383730 [Xylaria grammica]